jgi:hypothetical protein
MALESIHACDCANGFTYVGEVSVGGVGGTTVEEVVVSRYFVIPTKTLVERTWVKETGEDSKEHLKYVPYTAVASSLYRKLREQGTLNPKQVKLPHLNANHELDV